MTKYEIMSDNAIKGEQMALKGRLREMNAMLTRMVSQELGRKIGNSRVSSKACVSKEMKVDYPTLCRESIQNQNKIEAMKSELS